MSKLPSDTIITPAKLRDYLLVWRGKDDKSKWLVAAGYTADNWRRCKQNSLRFTRIGSK